MQEDESKTEEWKKGQSKQIEVRRISHRNTKRTRLNCHYTQPHLNGTTTEKDSKTESKRPKAGDNQ